MASIEKHSDTWRAVKAKAEAGLETARRALEATGHPIDKTEYERGKIKAYREILELAEAQTVMPSSDPLY